ncbi:predicted protein, partial [Thalassiosira pseudonana CCMP1335]
FNGGSILAMSGRNSVAIAIDARFGLGMQTIATMNTDNDDASDGNPRIVLLPNSNTLLAWTGLYGDGISFAEEMNKMSPRAITMLVSHLLYRRRSAPYYVEPVVVGLENVRVPPYLVTTDMLGAQSTSTSFVCSGVASRSLHGTAEALWRPNLEGEELVEVCGRAFVSALERDCLSGYGAVVYLI